MKYKIRNEKAGPPPQFLAITRKDISFGEEDGLLLVIILPCYVVFCSILSSWPYPIYHQ